MDLSALQAEIETAFETISELTPTTQGPVRTAVAEALRLLDSGQARVAEKVGDSWITHQWLKKAVLMSFRLNANEVMRVLCGKLILQMAGIPDIRFGKSPEPVA